MLPKCFYLVMLIVVSLQVKGKCFIREFFSQFSIVPYHRIDMHDHDEWGARRREDSRELTICDAPARRRAFETKKYFVLQDKICDPRGILRGSLILNTTLN